MNDLKFSPNGAFIASASRDETVKIWNNRPDGSFSSLKGHTASVNSLSFGNLGKTILTGADDKTLKYWDLQNSHCAFTLTGHTGPVKSVKLSRDEKIAASGGQCPYVRIWDMNKALEILSFTGHLGTINSVSMHNDGNCIATGGDGNALHLYDLRSQHKIAEYKIHNGAITDLCFHPTEPYILTSGVDGKVKLLDLSSGKLAFTINAHNGASTCVKFSKFGDYFATGGEDNLAMVWKTHFLDSGKENLKPEDYLNVVDEGEKRHYLGKENYVSCLRKMTNLGKSKGGFSEGDKMSYQDSQVGGGGRDDGAVGKEPQFGYTGANQNFVNHVLPGDVESKLGKIGSYLDVITNQLKWMNQRLTYNDRAINSVTNYIIEKYNYNPLTEQEVRPGQGQHARFSDNQEF